MPRPRRVVALATLALALSAAPAAASPAPPPHGFFGVVPSSLTAADTSRMAASGVATVRVRVLWGSIEAQPGQRNWTNYDAVIGALAAARLQMEPVLFGVPRWISPRASRPPIYTAAQRQAWTSFVAELGARYGPNGTFWRAHPALPYLPISAWELWNEPNLSGDWGGHRPNPRGFVRLLRLTRAGLDRSNPSAQIAIGGIFPPPRPHYGVSLEDYLRGIYRVPGARQAFDAVAIHPYASRPKGVLASMREARRILNRHGDGATPLWITEVGWTTGGRHWRRSPFKATESQQARFLSKAFLGLLRARQALGLELLIWFSWQDYPPGFPWTGYAGLIRSDGTAKPALNAYSSIATTDGLGVHGRDASDRGGTGDHG